MVAAFIMLTSLIALLPALMMIGGIVANGVALAIVAIATLAVALTLQTGDLNRFSRLLRPTAFLVLFIPCLWMLLQVLPVPAGALANPVWLSASEALNRTLVGTVSLDIGATLLCLACYCAILATAFVTAIVTLNKQRAKSLLFLLTAIAALIAAELVGVELGYLHFPGYEHPGEPDNAVNIAVIGFVLSCAMLVSAYKNRDSTRTSPAMRKVVISASMAALLICLSAILIKADAVLILVALFGAGVLVGVLAIRKWRLGPMGQAGIAALAAVALAGFFAIVPATKDANPTPASPAHGEASSIQRMLSDAKWAGSGAGSFAALLPIYQDSNEPGRSEIPTAATTIAVEMGRPFLWTCIIVLLIGASSLFKRALRRRRDYIYSAAGAGCIFALLISLFTNEGALGLTASLMISIVCGLAFAQSLSSSEPNLDALEAFHNVPIKTNDPSRRGWLLVVSRISTGTWLRVALISFSLVLSAQAGWILLAEGWRINHVPLPVKGDSTLGAFTEPDRIRQAASLAVVRGDLWAESAFTYGRQLKVDRAIEPDAADAADVRESLIRTLRFSPHRGDVWLMFAALADRYKWSGYEPKSLLKMSYYTAPNEIPLLPARLNVALRLKAAIEDAELQDMIRRDISVILTRAPAVRPGLAAAYYSASPQARIFAERVIAETDPGYLSLLRAREP